MTDKPICPVCKEKVGFFSKKQCKNCDSAVHAHCATEGKNYDFCSASCLGYYSRRCCVSNPAGHCNTCGVEMCFEHLVTHECPVKSVEVTTT